MILSFAMTVILPLSRASCSALLMPGEDEWKTALSKTQIFAQAISTTSLPEPVSRMSMHNAPQGPAGGVSLDDASGMENVNFLASQYHIIHIGLDSSLVHTHYYANPKPSYMFLERSFELYTRGLLKAAQVLVNIRHM